MTNISIVVEVAPLLAWLDSYQKEVIPRGVEAGLYRSALEILAESKELVPIGGPPTSPEDKHRGALRASGHVTLPEVQDGLVAVTIGYGGAASAWAERQHEDLTYRHKEGQTAMYLERPAAAYDKTSQNIVDAIQSSKGGDA